MQQHFSITLDFPRPEILHRNSSVKNPTYATGQIQSRPECLNDRITYLFITRDYLHSFMLESIYQNDYQRKFNMGAAFSDAEVQDFARAAHRRKWQIRLNHREANTVLNNGNAPKKDCTQNMHRTNADKQTSDNVNWQEADFLREPWS